ncbi:MAG: endonuclease, partial [Acholeplasmatales bacterium]|nr:endonuclease [Acholeplasmatales bacterium]
GLFLIGSLITFISCNGKALSYSVKFYVDDVEVKELVVISGKLIEDWPDEPVKDSVTFIGWYTSDDKVISFGERINKNYELYAKFDDYSDVNIVYHTVKFYSEAEVLLSEVLVGHNRILEASSFPDIADKDGFTFAGWYNNDTKVNIEARVLSDLNLRPKFVKNSDINELYYANINFNANKVDLKASLNNLIKGHKTYSYSSLNNYLSHTDESVTGNSKVIYLTYSGPNTNNYSWNKEHVWAQSRGQNGSFGTSNGIGTDMHHIRPSIVALNSARSNYSFDEGGVLTSSYPEYKNYVNNSAKTFEPRDEDKGDIARILFYMDVRYEGNDNYDNLTLSENAPSSSPYNGQIGRLSTLLRWNIEDPVSEQEISRNNRVYDLQGNRNPFIDHPELANKIFGSVNGKAFIELRQAHLNLVVLDLNTLSSNYKVREEGL